MTQTTAGCFNVLTSFCSSSKRRTGPSVIVWGDKEVGDGLSLHRHAGLTERLLSGSESAAPWAGLKPALYSLLIRKSNHSGSKSEPFLDRSRSWMFLKGQCANKTHQQAIRIFIRKLCLLSISTFSN